MPRPPWITESCLLLFFSALLEPLRLLSNQGLTRSDEVGLFFNLFIFALITWFLWKGHNWARWLAFVICILCLSELASLNEAQTRGKIFSTLYDAGVGIFLLCFLNTPHVRAWFRRRSLPPPQNQTN